MHLVHPTINIIKHRSGRVNYEEIFKLGEKKGTGPAPSDRVPRPASGQRDGAVFLPCNFKPG